MANEGNGKTAARLDEVVLLLFVDTSASIHVLVVDAANLGILAHTFASHLLMLLLLQTHRTCYLRRTEVRHSEQLRQVAIGGVAIDRAFLRVFGLVRVAAGMLLLLGFFLLPLPPHLYGLLCVFVDVDRVAR